MQIFIKKVSHFHFKVSYFVEVPSPTFSFDIQLLTKLEKFNLDVGAMKTGAFFPPKYRILQQPMKKMGKSIFQEKVFHHTSLRSSLPEDTLKDQWHVPLHKDLLLKSGDFIQFS